MWVLNGLLMVVGSLLTSHVPGRPLGGLGSRLFPCVVLVYVPPIHMHSLSILLLIIVLTWWSACIEFNFKGL